MKEKITPSKQNILKIEKLASLIDLTLEDIATFSVYERTDDYVGLSLAFGFDLDSFLDQDINQLDFSKICTKGGYLDDVFSIRQDCELKAVR